MKTIRTFCAWCNKKEKVNGTWKEVSLDLAQELQSVSSHGICEDCFCAVTNGLHPLCK